MAGSASCAMLAAAPGLAFVVRMSTGCSFTPAKSSLMYRPHRTVTSRSSLGSHIALKGVKYRAKSWEWTSSRLGVDTSDSRRSHTRMRSARECRLP